MRRYIILVSLFWFVQITAQVNSDLKPYINNIPTSPEVALLGRFGEIPVGYYTGTTEFSIPLYDIKEGNVSIPISLRYHSSGIKVEDEATWVGLGWDLSPGGEIIQEVRGKEDLLDTNLHQQMYPQDYSVFKSNIGANYPISFSSATQTGCLHMTSCEPMAALGNCLENYHNPDSYLIIDDLLRGEGQPDIYHYRFGEYTGKFYIHPETKEIVLIDKKQTILFEHSNTATNEGWVAKTLDGNEYYFQDYESSTGTNIYDFKGKTFKLTRIKLSTGNNLFFEYVDENYTQIKESSYAIINGNPWSSEYPIGGYFEYIINHKKTLSKIISSDTEVHFNLEDREDINFNNNDKLKKLKSIDVFSKKTTKKVKTFVFNYSYFPFNLVGVPLNNTGSPQNSFVAEHLDSFGKRLKLDEIKEIGYDGDNEDVSKPPYIFEYDTSVIMPLKNSCARDFFGYYNGKNNANLLPDLDYFDYPYTYFSNSIQPFNYTYTKSNRFTDNNFVGAYMLKKIHYPTGGSTEMTYEPNSFTNKFIPDNEKMQVARKLYTIEDKNQNNDTTQKIFQISRSTTVRFQNSIYDGFIPLNTNFTPYTQQQLSNAYIQLLRVDMTGGSPQVTTLRTWNANMVDAQTFNSNHGATWDEEIRLEYNPNPNIYYTVNVMLPDNIQNNTFNSVSVRSRISYIDDNGIDTSVSNMCGMRIKKITNYQNSNEIANIKEYNYSGGKLLNKFDPLNVTQTYYTQCIVINVIPYFNISVKQRIIVNSDDLISNSGNPIGYDEVEEVVYNQNSTETIGKNKFQFYNVPNENSKGYPTLLNQKNGFLMKEETFDKNNVLKRQNTYSITNINNNWISYPGILIFNHIIGNVDTNGSQLQGLKYTYGIYSIVSEQNLTTGKITREYLNGQEISNTEAYTYNSDGFIKTKTSVNSLGETILESYKYASDFSPYMIYGALMNYHMQGIPIEIEVFKNEELISKKVIQYDSFNNGILLPKAISNFKEGIWLSSKINLLGYNSNGLLKEFNIEESGLKTSIIYGYDETLPIAKVENVTYTQVQSYVTNLQTLSNGSDEQALINALNALRAALPNAIVTTFTYKPLIGVSTITDPKGMTTYYEYDSFGRLSAVKDAAGNKLSENEYHYKD